MSTSNEGAYTKLIVLEYISLHVPVYVYLNHSLEWNCIEVVYSLSCIYTYHSYNIGIILNGIRILASMCSLQYQFDLVRYSV